MYNGQNEYVLYKKRTERITECTCGTCPGNPFTCFVVDRSQFRSNGHQWIYTGYLKDAERMRTEQTAREPDKPHTNA